MFSILQSDLITFEVGPAHEKFILHLSIVTCQSPCSQRPHQRSMERVQGGSRVCLIRFQHSRLYGSGFENCGCMNYVEVLFGKSMGIDA